MTILVRMIAVTIAALLASASTGTRHAAPTDPTFALHDRASTVPRHPATVYRSIAPQRDAAPPSVGFQRDFSPAIDTLYQPTPPPHVAIGQRGRSLTPPSPIAPSLLEPAGIALLGLGTLVLLRRRLRY